MNRLLAVLVAILSLAAIAVATMRLLEADAGVTAERVTIGDTPAVVFRPAAGDAVAPEPPVVVVAHGFAGSKTLMGPFSKALAKNGYVAVAFDFLGHGEHSAPLAGDILDVDGPTRALVAQTDGVADYAAALPGTGGRLAVLGHSMASDIVVRFAQGREDVAATIAVSMFSPAVTAESPPNLLVVVGEWEAGLREEALRAVGLAVDGAAEEGVTYGDPAGGTGRRAVFADAAEHIAVLYDVESFTEAVAWLDATFGIAREGPVEASARLPWIGLLILGVLALAWPLSRLLPVVSRPLAGAGLGWRALWPVVVVPPLATPFLLTVVPTDFLPVVVGDYLAVHFLVYGLLTGLLLWWRGRRHGGLPAAGGAPRTGAMAVAAIAVTLYALGGLGLVIDWQVTNYLPVPARLPLLAAMTAGTLVYFLTAEWATRGEGGARGAFVAAKAAFLVSIALAIALDFERLFFLIIIIPVIVLFFVIYGLYSRWSYRRTGHPVPAAVANALAFSWAITVTFPMLAG